MNTTADLAARVKELRPPRRSVFRLVILALFIVCLVLSWRGAEMDPASLFDNFGNMFEMGADFFPPALGNWKEYLSEMLSTVYIAIWGTLLSVIAAVPFGILSSANITNWALYQPARRLMDILRSINEIVYGMIFVTAVGLGAFAGVLALFVSTTGILAKLFAEAVESIDPGPVEGVRATGGSKLQEIIYGVIPQVLPIWISLILYRFESNVRSATVLGIVGAGGIGVSLWENLRGFNYPESCTILLIIIVSVTIIDTISYYLRKLFI